MEPKDEAARLVQVNDELVPVINGALADGVSQKVSVGLLIASYGLLVSSGCVNPYKASINMLNELRDKNVHWREAQPKN